MKTIEKTRRRLFEDLNDGEYLGFYSGKYDDPIIEAKWLGFNGALDSVVIELPKISDQPVEDHYCWSACEEKCRAAIEAAGLKVKV